MSGIVEQSSGLIAVTVLLRGRTATLIAHGLTMYLFGGGGGGGLIFLVLGILILWVLIKVLIWIFSPAKSIFISYRRDDSSHITGRIYDRLLTRFGKKSVFKDVDSIPIGVDFTVHLQKRLKRCSVLVAVIGKNWNPFIDSGQHRLSDPGDHLRIEIESALQRRIPVIPVLVDGIKMPGKDELPETLAKLTNQNGISVRPDPDFHHDMDRLIKAIKKLT